LLGGFGDLTVSNPAPIDTVSVFYSENGKLTTIAAKKLDGPEKWPHGVWQGSKDWTESRTATSQQCSCRWSERLLAVSRLAIGRFLARPGGRQRYRGAGPSDSDSGFSAACGDARLRGSEDYDELKKMNPPLHSLVNFGWLEFIADPLFHGLKWLHNYIPNWGWAIVV